MINILGIVKMLFNGVGQYKNIVVLVLIALLIISLLICIIIIQAQRHKIKDLKDGSNITLQSKKKIKDEYIEKAKIERKADELKKKVSKISEEIQEEKPAEPHKKYIQVWNTISD